MTYTTTQSARPNTLALLEEVLVRARQEDGMLDRVDNYLIALARKAGLPEDTIEECLADSYPVVLYRP